MLLARDAFKLALLGFSHPVDWWGLPTRLEWALAPDRGVLGYQTGSLAACMAFGRLRGPRVQELKSSFLQTSFGLSAGCRGRRPKSWPVLGMTTQGLPVHA